MRDTLETLLQVRDEGLLARFAIGGAVAASFYAPAVLTEDLDIFAFLKPSASGLLLLTPLYDRLKALSGRVENEFIVLGQWPVQILPAYAPLVEEAVMHATEQSFEDLKVPVVQADQLKLLIEKFALAERWKIYVTRFAG